MLPATGFVDRVGNHIFSRARRWGLDPSKWFLKLLSESIDDQCAGLPVFISLDLDEML